MNKSPIPKVPCWHCNGSGRVLLSDELLETLEALKTRKTASARDLFLTLKLNCHPTAMNNRLEDLRGLGFLTRKRDGKRWLYRISTRK